MQSLAHTPPGLPTTAGAAATHTHDYIRHGTLSLRAALDIYTGKVYSGCAVRPRHPTCLAFLRSRARGFPTQQVHLVLGHYSPHRLRKVQT